MADSPEVKRISKISSLIGQAQENANSSQYIVHYSENNWETSEEIDLILDDNATISELIDAAKQKFKTELYYDNIDKKKFIVRIFKKKKKIPNLEYPVCNFDSKVGDFGKSHFCLVEMENEGENDVKENDDINENIQINKEKGKQIKNDEILKKDNSKEKNIKNNINKNSSNDNGKGEKTKINETENKHKCQSCLLF